MLALGGIHPSKSNWPSPLNIVPKTHSRDWRSCGDLQCLNNIINDDRYPILNMQGFAAMFEGKTIFTKIDLIRDLNHIPVNKVDIPETAAINLFGLL